MVHDVRTKRSLTPPEIKRTNFDIAPRTPLRGRGVRALHLITPCRLLRCGVIVFLLAASTLAGTPARTATYEGACALPYGGKVSHESLQAVARAVAWLDALNLATDALTHTAAQFGTQSVALRKALADAVHRPMVSMASGKLPGEAEEHVRVRVTLSTPARVLDTRLREALHYPDTLLLREAALRMAQDAAYEAESLAQAAAIAREGGDTGRESAYARRIADLSSRLEALWVLNASLEHLRALWQNPVALLRDLQRASELDPLNPLIWNALGEVQLQMDQPQNALHSLDSALGLDPALARALHARGLAHMRLRQFALAEADFDAALRRMPGHTEWLRSRGAVRMLRGAYGPMCEDFEQACALGDCEGLRAARAAKLCLPPADAQERSEPETAEQADAGQTTPAKPGQAKPGHTTLTPGTTDPALPEAASTPEAAQPQPKKVRPGGVRTTPPADTP